MAPHGSKGLLEAQKSIRGWSLLGQIWSNWVETGQNSFKISQNCSKVNSGVILIWSNWVKLGKIGQNSLKQDQGDQCRSPGFRFRFRF